jgi:hypothetical protein
MRRARLLVALTVAIGCGSKKEAGKDGGAAAPAGPVLQVSKPTPLAVAALEKVKAPQALLFLQPGPVADQVVGYLGDLAKQAGVALEVRELDRLLDVDEARLHKVVNEALVLVSGERAEKIPLDADPARGAKRLAALNQEVAFALEKLGRTGGSAALVRHQVADVDRYTMLAQAPPLLGLKLVVVTPGEDVPAGAVAILLDVGAGPLGPALESIDRHLAAGGSALIAVEPGVDASLGPLEKRLGVALGAGSLADDKDFMVRLNKPSDHGLLITNGVAAHPSVTTMSRGGVKAGALFMTAGHLVETDAAPGATRVVTIRSMPASFIDRDGDFERDDEEKRDRYPIAIAVTQGASRAVVVADADWLSDQILRQVPMSQAMLVDGLRWLGGEEEIQETVPGDPATGDKLTSYPARPVKPRAAAAAAALWQEKPEAVRVIRYRDRSKTVILERRASGLWGRIELEGRTGSPPSSREFPLSADAEKLFEFAARPVPLRALGPLDDAASKRFGLDAATITIELAGSKHTLSIGKQVYGGADRYAADPERKLTFILPGHRVDFERAELYAVRKPLALEEDAITKMIIARGGKSVEATRAAGGDWTVSGGTSDQAFAADAIARAALELRAVDFVETEPKGLEPAATLTFTAAGPPVTLEIFTSPGDAYWIRSPQVRALGELRSDAATRLLDTITQLLPAD